MFSSEELFRLHRKQRFSATDMLDSIFTSDIGIISDRMDTGIDVW